ncbi:MAG: hypothetical protein J0H06_01990, partial [Actinobacteria bacterium]|nr:hypothetical protein [Actinomycetota bacterium]
IKKTEELAKPEAEAAGEEAFKKEGKILTPAEAEAAGIKRAEAKAGAEAKALEIVAGEPLGSFSFIATGE